MKIDKTKQTADSFGKLWTNNDYIPNPNTNEAVRLSLTEQFESMLGMPKRAEALDDIIKPGMKVLNAGCGTGWTEVLFQTPDAMRYGIDISNAIETALEATQDLSNTTILRMDIANMTFRAETFDVIFSNGVLHHTSDPSGNFSKLVDVLKPGGLIGLYVYCHKPLIREMCDYWIRKETTNMTFEDCQKFAGQITMLGESLSAIEQPLELNTDIPILGMKAGTYNLQRFIYEYMLKCFFNEDMGFAYSEGINVDWYHPKYASHHSKKEIEGWFADNDCGDVIFIDLPGWEHSGYFVSGVKK